MDLLQVVSTLFSCWINIKKKIEKQRETTYWWALNIIYVMSALRLSDSAICCLKRWTGFGSFMGLSCPISEMGVILTTFCGYLLVLTLNAKTRKQRFMFLGVTVLLPYILPRFPTCSSRFTLRLFCEWLYEHIHGLSCHPDSETAKQNAGVNRGRIRYLFSPSEAIFRLCPYLRQSSR